MTEAVLVPAAMADLTTLGFLALGASGVLFQTMMNKKYNLRLIHDYQNKHLYLRLNSTDGLVKKEYYVKYDDTMPYQSIPVNWLPNLPNWIQIYNNKLNKSITSVPLYVPVPSWQTLEKRSTFKKNGSNVFVKFSDTQFKVWEYFTFGWLPKVNGSNDYRFIPYMVPVAMCYTYALSSYLFGITVMLVVPSA